MSRKAKCVPGVQDRNSLMLLQLLERNETLSTQLQELRGTINELTDLTKEIASDNVSLYNSINNIKNNEDITRNDILRGMNRLHEDFGNAISYRVLKDLCCELAPTLTAIENLINIPEIDDPQMMKNHLKSILITIQSILSRYGADRIEISLGRDLFDPSKHKCERIISSVDSPYPDACSKTVVSIIEHGYCAGNKTIMPSKVVIIAEKGLLGEEQNKESEDSVQIPTDNDVGCNYPE
jgi:molecular chaperone GrpE (heat shock protein)